MISSGLSQSIASGPSGFHVKTMVDIDPGMSQDPSACLTYVSQPI